MQNKIDAYTVCIFQSIQPFIHFIYVKNVEKQKAHKYYKLRLLGTCTGLILQFLKAHDNLLKVHLDNVTRTFSLNGIATNHLRKCTFHNICFINVSKLIGITKQLMIRNTMLNLLVNRRDFVLIHNSPGLQYTCLCNMTRFVTLIYFFVYYFYFKHSSMPSNVFHEYIVSFCGLCLYIGMFWGQGNVVKTFKMSISRSKVMQANTLDQDVKCKARYSMKLNKLK